MSRTSRSVPVDSAFRRRRPAARARVAAVGLVLVAGFALSGCSESRAGAAAMVAGDRIEISTLNAKVDKLEQAFTDRDLALAGTAAQLEANQAELVQMIQRRVVDEAARRNNITINATQVLQARRTLEQQFDNPAELEARLLQTGVLPGEIDDFVRTEALKPEIAKARGIDISAPGAREKLNRYLGEVAGWMKITVNPRYGTWDAAKLTTVASEYSWLAPGTTPAGKAPAGSTTEIPGGSADSGA
ncbi:SurA N-terminal domain-containing protein [Embleya sp. NBC_00896]|uniref:SurA N-terminal domain-containing protein n=1 Tax=Embleya sp. NBC_00896 TaxID=2975961 RepID=UPI003865AD5D|nr:SurA N-terminal domain-containing protein [Embleya sp. NBC_00896]